MKENVAKEIWDTSDDWIGVVDAKERRRRQNRVHQRAYRKKRRALPTVVNSGDQEPEPMTLSGLSKEICARTSSHLASLVRQGQSPALPAFHSLPDFLTLINCALLSRQIRLFLDHAYQNWSIGRPVPRDLPTLSRLNAFDALVRNAQILHIPVEALASDDDDSPLLENGRQSSGDERQVWQFPIHLSPTDLQRSVPHHAWLDLFPFPSLRDRILRGIQVGELDEDTISNELCCELLNLEAKSDAPVMVWGESWKASGWEFSPGFIERWAGFMHDCPEIIAATNHWRGIRGDESILPYHNGNVT